MRSFVKTDDAPSAPPVETAPAPSTTTAVSRPNSSPYVEGEITASDIRIPWLTCVAGVGPKSVLYSSGTIVLGETVLSKAPEPKQPTPRLRILFCRPSKTYVENLPYDPSPTSPRPRIFRKESEVKETGGTLEYVGRTAPTFVPRLTSPVLIRQPSDIEDDQFCFIADDKAYAPGMVGFQKSAYSAAKTLLTDLASSLKNDPRATFYDLFWAKEPKGQNWVWVPKLVRVREEKPSDAIKALVDKLIGRNIETEDDGGAE